MRWIQVEKPVFIQVCDVACMVVYRYCNLLCCPILLLTCRYTHNSLEGWKVVDIRKRRSGRPVDMGTVTLDNLYSGPRSTQ